MDNTLSAAFTEASKFFVGTVRLVPDVRWESPGLGSWSVRELVGHANRGQTTVIDYLLHPLPPEPPGSAYFAEDSIAARGREAVVALGEDATRAVNAASARVISLIEHAPSNAIIGSPAGTMTLEQYLPSRIAELTIHGIDIARAIGADVSAPMSALQESLAFVGRLSARRGGGDVVLLALSGRGELAPGYSVY
jgi:uncharacterized protein (TIGR03083 family)